MKTYTIPTYTYLKDTVSLNEKQFATSYQFICCDDLYNKFNPTLSGGVIWDKEWSNQQENNPARIIDLYLEHPILENNIPTYTLYKPNSPTADDPNIQCRQNVTMMKSMADLIRSNVTYLVVDTNDYNFNASKVILVNNAELNDPTPIQIGEWNTINYPNVSLSGKSISGKDFVTNFSNYSSPPYRIQGYIPVYPEDIIVDNEINEEYLDNPDFHTVYIRYMFDCVATIGIDNTIVNYCKNFKVGHETVSTLEDSPFITQFKGVPLTGSLINSNEDNDPYSELEESDTGGGDGSMDPISIDSVDPAVIPSLPNISVTDLGLITMYNPTASQIKDLSTFLWSSAFDINTFKKLFTDPMQALIGLSIVPVTPTAAGSQHIMLGSVDTGVSAIKCGSNWVQLDCGSVDIEKFVGNFMDADPYTEIQI